MNISVQNWGCNCVAVVSLQSYRVDLGVVHFSWTRGDCRYNFFVSVAMLVMRY